MTERGRLALLVGVLVAGLSPSFVDWEQSPKYRWQMVTWYSAAGVLVAFGLWDGR